MGKKKHSLWHVTFVLSFTIKELLSLLQYTLLNILSASRTNDDHYVQSVFVAPKNERKERRIKFEKQRWNIAVRISPKVLDVDKSVEIRPRIRY